MRTDHRTCPLCEATCGVTVTIDDDADPGGRVVSVRGDADDVFSHGFICPKGVALGDLHHDPDRLRTPLIRDRESGALQPASWEEAFDAIRAQLGAVIREHGPNAVAVYLGNPNAHNISSTFYVSALIRALGTGYRFSASTVDQMPKQVSAGLMFGTELSVPIPDIDRTDMFLVLGGNPMVSNGSLMTAPDFRVGCERCASVAGDWWSWTRYGRERLRSPTSIWRSDLALTRFGWQRSHGPSTRNTG